MATQHIGDEDELVLATEPAENPGPPDPAENPGQPEPAEISGPPNSVGNPVIDQPEPGELPHGWNGRCPHPPRSTLMQPTCTVSGNTG